jgi:hypothetical protein
MTISIRVPEQLAEDTLLQAEVADAAQTWINENYPEQMAAADELDDDPDPLEQLTEMVTAKIAFHDGIEEDITSAISRILDYSWDDEKSDYLVNCADVPGANQRAGHVFEDMMLVHTWLAQKGSV